MSLRVYNIENLFWDNTTFKVPNCVPDLQGKFVASSPVMIDYLTGYIDLYGDYNYCKYKNVYYILKKDKPLDINRKHWKYVLIRDFWVNFLTKKRISVVGDVVVWNDDTLLSKHLNKCIPSLDTPAELLHLNFDEREYDWRKDLEIKKAEEGKLPQLVISSKEYDYFKNTFISRIALYKLADKYLYVDRKQQFIFAALNGTYNYKGWKNKVISLINKSLEDFKDDKKGKKRQVSKVDKDGSPLNQLYCITYTENSIGTAVDETLWPRGIDLTGLTDIKAIRWNDLKEPLPNKELNYSTGVFFIGEQEQEQEQEKLRGTFVKICRKGYLPIKSSQNENLFLKIEEDRITRGWHNNAPQTITLFNTGEQIEDGQLWWVDKLDFVLFWHLETIIPEEVIDEPKPWVETWNSNLWDKQLMKTMKEKTPAYGFLMFQTVKLYDQWELFEYTGEHLLDSLPWYSGFNNKLFEKYNAPDLFRHQNLAEDQKLSKLAGNWIFTKLNLDLNNFTFLYFAPGSQVPGRLTYINYSYFDKDDFGIWRFLNRGEGYGIDFIYYDILDPNGAVARTNPYSLERYPEFASKRQQWISEITIQSDLKLPRQIKKGDWFFSSQEYSFKEYESNWDCWNCFVRWRRDENQWEKFLEHFKYWSTGDYNHKTFDLVLRHATAQATSFRTYIVKSRRDTLTTVGDFCNLNLRDEVDTNYFKDKVLLCSNLKGEIEFRVFESFEHTHHLSTEGNQIVKAVDGATSATFTYYLFHRHELKPSSIDTWKELKQTIELLYLFYKTNGYSVSITETVDRNTANWFWLDDKDLEESEAGNLFDLVGTAWYAFIRKGQVHLICKHDYVEDCFYKKKFNLSFFQKTSANFKRLQRLPLIGKINQQNVLSIYTQPFNLKTKFLFTEEEYFNVKANPLDPTTLATQSNYFLVTANNDFDVIHEWVTVSKEPLATLSIADQISLDKLTLDMQRAREDYDISHSRNIDFALEKHKTAFERAEWDLNIQQIQSGINLGFSAVHAAASFSGFGVSAAKFGAAILRGKAKTTTLAGRGINLAEQGLTTPAGLVGGIMDMAVRIPEQRRRLEQDREYAARDIAYNAYQLDLSHFRRKQDSLLALNDLTNRYHRPEINNRSLIKQYNKEFNLNDINIRVYVPTDHQLHYLEAYRREHGVDCYIPGITFSIYSGMPHNIVRMVNIDITKGGIYGLTDKLEIEFLINKLRVGIHIVECSALALRPSIELAEVTDVSQYTEKIKELVDKIGEQEITLQEYEKTKSILAVSNTRIEELNKTLNSKEEQLRTADNRLRETAEKAHNLEERLNTCLAGGVDEESLKKLREDLNVANNRIEQDRGKIDYLENDLQTTKNQLQEAIQKKEELAGQVVTLERQLSEAGEYQQLITKKEELEGQVVTLTNELSIAQERIKRGEDIGGYTLAQIETSFYCFLTTLVNWFTQGMIRKFQTYNPTEDRTFHAAVTKRIKNGGNPYFADTNIFVRNAVLISHVANYIALWKTNPNLFKIDKAYAILYPHRYTPEQLSEPNLQEWQSQLSRTYLYDSSEVTDGLNAWKEMEGKCKLPEAKPVIDFHKTIEDNKKEYTEQLAKADKEHQEEIKNLNIVFNRQLTQANNRANTLHDSYEKANTKAQEQEKLALLYKEETNTLKREIAELKAANAKAALAVTRLKERIKKLGGEGGGN